MAFLNSINDNKTLELQVLRYEHEGESWVTSKLNFKKNNKVTLKEIGSFLQVGELTSLIESISTP